jgi:hypothetical protein
MNKLHRALISVTNQLYANAGLRCLLLVASAGLLVAAVGGSAGWIAGVSLVGLLAGAYLTRLREDKKPQAIRLLHRLVDDAEYSLTLLTKTDLNPAEQLQLNRLNERAGSAVVPGLIPSVILAQTRVYGLGLLVALLVYAGYPMLAQRTNLPASRSFVSATAPERQPETPPRFLSAELQSQPPAYSRLSPMTSPDLNRVALAGSGLRWRVRFSDTRQLTVRLVGSAGQTADFRRSGAVFIYQDRLLNSGLYALKAWWRIGGRDSVVYQSDFYRLEARPDLPPKIEPGDGSPVSTQLYRFHALNDPKMLTVTARMSDDFMVSQAFMVATVARGSGENVNFRELKIPLGPANFREARLTKTIDLKALNFAPGDELYYYWAALDNRQPTPNFTKSDTYFLVFRDTTNQDEGALATMAMNVMPAYFRSQRQIIIDTEKLLAQKKRIPVSAFNGTSNEIGYDQKVLRLRYGQFLGEEFETSIGGVSGGPPDDGGDMLAGYRHDHDHGEGHAETGPAGAEPPHDHGPEHPRDGENQDPMAALMAQYVHEHDNAETNTFHEQSTRSLLKMALEQMWQSELHLRLYEPEKALPFEHKALEYLKLSQQKARSYVKKTGFDPPPINEKETRLTGELTRINAAVNQKRNAGGDRIGPLVATVLGYLDLPRLTNPQRLTVQQLGNAIAGRVLNSGLTNWSVLAGLQKLAGDKSLSALEKQQLKTRLHALTDASARSGRSYTSNQSLERAFWQRLH